MTKKQILWLIVIIVVVAGIVLPKWNPFRTEAQNQSQQSARSQKVPVKVVVVKPQTLQDKVSTTGTILANESVELRSETSGKVTKISFREGSRVKKGQVLVKINDSELQAQLLELQQQKTLAKDKEYRQKQLLKKQAVSQETYDNTLNDLKNIEAQIQLTQAKLEKTEIQAPFEGIIGLRYISEGDYISPTTRIATLQDIDPVKIDFSVPEKYARTVQPDDKIHFTPGGNSKVFEGTVYAIEPKIDPDTRTLAMRAVAENTSHNLLPGSFVQVELILHEIPGAILIPTQALIPEFQGQKVYLVKHGKATPVKVETGIRTAENIQILNGVSSQDTVVTAGILQLRPGADVEITEYTD